MVGVGSSGTECTMARVVLLLGLYGVVVAAKTSRARVEGLHAAIARAVNAPDVKEKLIAQGYDPLANTPAEFSIYLKAEVAKWAKVVKDSGLKAD